MVTPEQLVENIKRIISNPQQIRNIAIAAHI